MKECNFLLMITMIVMIVTMVGTWITLAAISHHKRKKEKATKSGYEKLKSDLEELEQISANKRNELTSLIQNFSKQIEQLDEIVKEKEKLKNTIDDTNLLLSTETERKKLEKIEIEQQISNFTTARDLLKTEVNKLEQTRTELSTSVKGEEIAYKKICKSIEEDSIRLGVLAQDVDKMAAQKLVIEGEVEKKRLTRTSLQEEIDEMSAILAEKDKIMGELEVLKSTHKEALLRNNEKDGANLFVSQKNFLPIDEARWAPFNKLIDELKEKYPEIEGDLAKIQWSKAYLPAFQKMCKVLEADEGGIYKISVKGNEDRCYIGKAQTSIKDRWYNHAKKMLGVESKGGEWLYNSGLRPEELVWEVLERGTEKLDERERYWIEFFGCLEVGLNRI